MIMTWRRTGDKPLSKSMMVWFPTSLSLNELRKTYRLIESHVNSSLFKGASTTSREYASVNSFDKHNPFHTKFLHRKQKNVFTIYLIPPYWSDNVSILYSRYHGCWCLSISNRCIDFDEPEQFGSRALRVKIYLKVPNKHTKDTRQYINGYHGNIYIYIYSNSKVSLHYTILLVNSRFELGWESWVITMTS